MQCKIINCYKVNGRHAPYWNAVAEVTTEIAARMQDYQIKTVKQCTLCWRIGHTKVSCTNAPLCKKCSRKECMDKTMCTAACVSCAEALVKSDHPNMSFKCRTLQNAANEQLNSLFSCRKPRSEKEGTLEEKSLHYTTIIKAACHRPRSLEI